MSLYLGTNLISGTATNTISNAHSLLDFKWSDHILNEMSWLRADTFSWQSGLVYVAAYQHLTADYANGTSKTETISGYTITYVEATDGHKITTDETNVINIYNATGVAWYYVLDTTNQRFKLPRINPIREELLQLIRVKGDGKVLGFTDGTDNLGITRCNLNGTMYASGYNALYGADVGTTATGGTIQSVKGLGVTTDSTKSGIIANVTDSTSVFKGKKYLYFYVGEFSQSATEQTAGLNSELFNGKADRNLQNVTSNLDFVVESYQNGTEWYRLYKSGWIEQGGAQSAGANVVKTFLKPFSNTNYTLVTGTLGANSTDVYACNIKEKTTTTFKTYTNAGYTSIEWYACGY